ncbi:MAG: hypothetical protein NT164_05020, partial [Verrucomicrobiae bacterium]|nr:hypothetical protein [Verrucomicrobiae bacterium]
FRFSDFEAVSVLHFTCQSKCAKNCCCPGEKRSCFLGKKFYLLKNVKNELFADTLYLLKVVLDRIDF